MNGNIPLSDEELFKNMLSYMYDKGVFVIQLLKNV